MNWKILVTLIIISGIVGTAYAAPNETKKNLEISESWTFATANESEIGIFLEIKNNFPNENGQIYPVRVRYFYGDKKLYSRTIDINWFSSYTFSAHTFALDEKYDPQKEVRIEIVDRNGNLIDSKSQYYEPRYKFDLNQQKADIQLVNINITKTKFGIFSFRDDYYSVHFTLKNTNASYAFRGSIDFGDFGEPIDRHLQNWRVHYDLILEPLQSFEIERSGMTEEEIKNVKTELQTCMFC